MINDRKRHKPAPRSVGRLSSLLFGLGGITSVVIGGCGLFTGGDCTTEARPAIRLTIRDTQTGHNPTVASLITVTDGQFMETYPPAGSASVILDQYQFAPERPGHYSILVHTLGYQDWTQSDITVGTGSCNHVRTADVTALLTPTPP